MTISSVCSKMAIAAIATSAILLATFCMVLAFRVRIRDESLLRGQSSSSSSSSSSNSFDDVDHRLPSSKSLPESNPITEYVSVGHHHSRSHSYNHKHEEGNSADFDLYVYSMQYQPEACYSSSSKSSHEACQRQGKPFTIHGLWPTRTDGSWPTSCKSQHLDVSPNSTPFSQNDLFHKLEENWPSYEYKTLLQSSKFWAHEWYEHGSCSGLSPYEYFSSAVDVMLPTPKIIEDIYSKNGMDESDDKDDGDDDDCGASYRSFVGSVHAVSKKQLLEEYGGPSMATPVCTSGYLVQVKVCFEKGEGGIVGKRIECPEVFLKKDSCGDKIKISPFVATSFA